MGVVVPLFKEVPKEDTIKTTIHEGLSAISERNIYANVLLQIDYIKQLVLTFHNNDYNPELIEDLSLGYDGLYTLLDLLANSVSGTLLPSYLAKQIQIHTLENEPDNFGVLFSLTQPNAVGDDSITRKMTLTITQLTGVVFDPELTGGVVDETWDDRTLDPDWDVPGYMANIIDNLMCMALCNSGYAAYKGDDVFVVTLPFHPLRCIQLYAKIT